MVVSCFATVMSSFVLRGSGLRAASPTRYADHTDFMAVIA